MKLEEAITALRSGKEIRLPEFGWLAPEDKIAFPYRLHAEDLLRDDWEIGPERREFTREELVRALSAARAIIPNESVFVSARNMVLRQLGFEVEER